MWRRSRTPIGVFKGGQIRLKVKVKFFNSQKGFGFIQPTDGGPDVFVHISAVERAVMSNLNEGQKLTYDVVSERGKLAASNPPSRNARSTRSRVDVDIPKRHPF